MGGGAGCGRQEVGLDPSTLGTVVARHPQMLTNSVEEMMAPKIAFLQGLGVSREGIIKMVTRHPQILQYKIESMLPRLQYLQVAPRLPPSRGRTRGWWGGAERDSQSGCMQRLACRAEDTTMWERGQRGTMDRTFGAG